MQHTIHVSFEYHTGVIRIRYQGHDLALGLSKRHTSSEHVRYNQAGAGP
jgi:hypothetical protein